MILFTSKAKHTYIDETKYSFLRFFLIHKIDIDTFTHLLIHSYITTLLQEYLWKLYSIVGVIKYA